MQLKTKNLKFITRSLKLAVLGLFLVNSANAQELIITDSTAIQPQEQQLAMVSSANENPNRMKVDGVAAVIGDFVVLDSDVDKMYIEMESQGASLDGVTNCNLAGRLMEEKLYAHHAIQDSLVVSEGQIQGQIDQQLAYMTQQLGSMDRVVEFYKKEDESELRTELATILRERQLASMMQETIVNAVEITPEEVREFFVSIPEDERPMFGDEVQIAQIVVKPEVPQEERQELIDRLNEYRADVVENGASFSTKAVLYSQDPGTRSSGGKITLGRKDPYVREFKEAAFSLQEGEVSRPFETQFGFHILQVEAIRGQQVDVRHILLIPDVTEKTKQEAFDKIQKIRQRLVDNELEFAEAAREFSDEEETSPNGGQLINPTTGDRGFELTNLDPGLYSDVVNLQEGDVSNVLVDADDTGRPFYKLITVTQRTKEHIAEFALDYDKIMNLALQEKQLRAIEKWQQEKIQETYVKINGKYRDCTYTSNWLKN